MCTFIHMHTDLLNLWSNGLVVNGIHLRSSGCAPSPSLPQRAQILLNFHSDGQIVKALWIHINLTCTLYTYSADINTYGTCVCEEMYTIHSALQIHLYMI